MRNQSIYIFLTLVISITLLLSSFELTLWLFHSPYGSAIIEPKSHQLTWIYLLKQEYISFIDLDIFNIHEKRHLLDVKRTFETIYNIWTILSIITIVIIISLYLFYKDKFIMIMRYLIYIGVITILLSVVISFDFLNSFSFLHQLIFPNQSWIFTDDSILIKWFPLRYFKEFATIMISLYLIFQVILAFFARIKK
jgi:integral membrane protein (TIGR01906 family)